MENIICWSKVMPRRVVVACGRGFLILVPSCAREYLWPGEYWWLGSWLSEIIGKLKYVMYQVYGGLPIIAWALSQLYTWMGLRRLSQFLKNGEQRAQCENEGGGEGGVILVAKRCMRVCAQNYSGARFIAPSRGPIPNPSPDPGPAGDWGGDFRGSCGNMIS